MQELFGNILERVPIHTLQALGIKIVGMAKRMPPEVLEYLRSMGKAYGKIGGKRSLETMTPEQRSVRAKKASLAAAKKRTAKRLAGEATLKRPKKTTKPK